MNTYPVDPPVTTEPGWYRIGAKDGKGIVERMTDEEVQAMVVTVPMRPDTLYLHGFTTVSEVFGT